MIGFVGGLFVGAIIGVFLTALVAGRRDDFDD